VKHDHEANFSSASVSVLPSPPFLYLSTGGVVPTHRWRWHSRIGRSPRLRRGSTSPKRWYQKHNRVLRRHREIFHHHDFSCPVYAMYLSAPSIPNYEIGSFRPSTTSSTDSTSQPSRLGRMMSVPTPTARPTSPQTDIGRHNTTSSSTFANRARKTILTSRPPSRPLS
jgi:hypothetical protein